MQLTFSKANLFSLGFVLISLTSFSQKQLYIVTTDTGFVEQKFDSTTMGPKLNIKIDENLLNSNSNQKIKIVLPNGSPKGIVVNAIKKKQVTSSNQFAWYGQIENQPKSFVLITQVKDVIAGHIRTNDDKIYRITFIGNKVHQIKLIDQRFFKPDKFALAGSFDPAKSSQLRREAASCCDESVIDVLVIYTPAAKRAAGGLAGIESRIGECINQTNESFQNSNIPVQIEKTYSAMVEYHESGSVEIDRDALQNPIDRNIDEVHTLRDNYNADIVVLLVNDANYSGIAYIMDRVEPAFESYAFCVVRLDDAFSNLSFAHEIGHLLGARHECNSDYAMTPFPYSHGYSIDLNRTIMSTNAAVARKEFWSDPNINFEGTNIPTGSMAGNCQANDAECLRKTFAIVAKFRCKQKCTTGEPSESTVTPSSFTGLRELTITPNSTIQPSIDTTIEQTVTPNPLISTSSKHSNSWLAIIAIVIIIALILWFILKRKKDS